jgi:hypothetical protein
MHIFIYKIIVSSFPGSQDVIWQLLHLIRNGIHSNKRGIPESGCLCQQKLVTAESKFKHSVAVHKLYYVDSSNGVYRKWRFQTPNWGESNSPMTEWGPGAHIFWAWQLTLMYALCRNDKSFWKQSTGFVPKASTPPYILSNYLLLQPFLEKPPLLQ